MAKVLNLGYLMVFKAIFIGLFSCFPLIIQAKEIVGSDGGSISVGNSGQASWTMPIDVPPGINGLTPKLEVSVSSSGGNSYLGLGGGLSGLSAITRCAKTVFYDGYTKAPEFSKDDAYCLDGQRLALQDGVYGQAGSIYRTEVESFQKIIAHGSTANRGPTYFEVVNRAGASMFYGKNANTNTFDLDPETGAVATWKIDTLRDSNTNTLHYEYSDISGSGEVQLSRISYGANENKGITANLFVDISYEDRPDKSVFWNRGTRYQQSKRIDAIRTKVGSATIVEEYIFTYEQGEISGLSRLAKVQECAATTGECYRPSRFNYQPEGSNAWQVSSLNLPGNLQTADGKPLGLLTDINNDGLTDWVNAYRDANGQNHISTYLGSRNGWQSSATFSLPNVLFDYEEMTEGFAKGSLLDVNSDGFPDYVQAYETATETVLTTWRNTGSGFQLDASLNLPVALVSSAFGSQSIAQGDVVDINGDSLLDVVEAYRLPNGETRLQTWLHTFNAGQHEWTINVDYEAPSIATDYSQGAEGRAYASIQDINSDGLADWVVAYQEGSTFQSSLWLNTGQGWVLNTSYKLPKPLFNYSLAAKGVSEYTLNDINGDGQLDLVKAITINDENQFDTWINTGIGWQQDSSYNLPAPMIIVNGLGNSANIGGIVDLNGDGFPDFFQNYQTVDQQSVSKQQWVYEGGWQTTSDFALPLTNAAIQADGTNLLSVQLADLNGDGFPEAFSATEGAATNVFTKNTLAADQIDSYPGNLIGTINPMGGITELYYGYSTDSSLYEPSAISAYPNVAYNSPIRLVSMIGTSSGRKVNSQQEMIFATHAYAKGKTNLQGIGGLGYAQHKMMDNLSGLEIVTEFHQSYPFIGRIKGSVKSIDELDVSTSSSKYEIKNITIEGLTTVYPHPYESTAMAYIFNEPLTATSLVTKTVSTAEIDNFGNTVFSEELIYDAQNVLRRQAKTDTDYENNISSWILGMPIETTSTLIDPVEGKTYVNKSMTKFFSDGKVEYEIAEPGNSKAVRKDYTYDGFGNRDTSTTSANGVLSRTTSIKFTTSGRFPWTVENALGHKATSIYNEVLGKPKTVTDANGITKEFVYDGFGTVVKETKAHQSNGATRGRQIVMPRWCNIPESESADCPDNAAYFIAAFDDEGEAPEIAFYDVNGKELRKQTYGHKGQIIAVETIYNTEGKVKQASKPYFLEKVTSDSEKKWTYFNYDKLGREVEHINVDGDVFKTIYDGLTITKENPGNATSGIQKTTITNDIFGKTIKSIDPDNNITTYKYDIRGLLVETIDAHGNVASIEYDEVFGRKDNMNDPDLGMWSYQYNALGQLVSQTDANDLITVMTYDLLGRMDSRTDAAGTPQQSVTTWKFDGEEEGDVKGGLKLVETKTSNGDVLYSRAMKYDNYGRAIKSDSTIMGNDASVPKNYVQRTGYLGTADKVDWIEYPSSLTVRSTYDDYGFPKTVEGIDLNYPGYEDFQTASKALNELQSDFEVWKNENLDYENLMQLEALESQIRLQGKALSGFYERFEKDPRKTALDDEAKRYSDLVNNVQTKLEQHENWLEDYSGQLRTLSDQIKPDLEQLETLQLQMNAFNPDQGTLISQFNSNNGVISSMHGRINSNMSNIYHTLNGVLQNDHARRYFFDIRDNAGLGVFAQDFDGGGRMDYVVRHYMRPGMGLGQMNVAIDQVFGQLSHIETWSGIIEDKEDDNDGIQIKLTEIGDVQTQINTISTRIQPKTDRMNDWLSPIVTSHNNVLLSFTDRSRLYSNEVSKIAGTYANRKQLGFENYFNAFQNNINYVKCLRDQTNKTTGECYAENLVFLGDADPSDRQVRMQRPDVDKYLQVDVKDFWNKQRFFCAYYYGYVCHASYRDYIAQLAKTIHVYQCQNQARHADPARQLLTDAEKNRELSCKSSDWVASNYSEAGYPYLYVGQIGNFDNFMNSLKSSHQTTIETKVCSAGANTYGEECNPFADIVAGNIWEVNPSQEQENEANNEETDARDFVLLRKGSMQNLITSSMTKEERDANAQLKGAQFSVQALLGDSAYTEYYLAILDKMKEVQDLYNHIDAAYASAENDEAYEQSKKIYWQAEEINAAGQILSAKYGNGTISSWGYDDFGRIDIATVRDANNEIVINNNYRYDAVGNLMLRHDKFIDFKEDFSYDIMNRLTGSLVSGDGAAEMESFGVAQTTYEYDEIGNIKKKSDFSSGAEYFYGNQNHRPSNAGPHAVLSIGSNSFTYDKNGNQLTGNGRTTTYSSFNKPTKIIKDGFTTDMRYGAERQLIWQRDDGDQVVSNFKQTYYVGGLYEEEITPSGEQFNDSEVKQRHSIAVAGQVIAIVEKDAATNEVKKESYLHKNHQGSVIAISDQSGSIVERRYYDAFGKLRRGVTGVESSIGGLFSYIGDYANSFGQSYITDIGFTGHKHLESAGIIHMGGRVFDPEVGRFMSADPHIQAPLNSQSLNRYSYTLNNPLSFTDPSGYFFSSILKKLKKLFDKIKKIIKKVVEKIKKVAKKLREISRKIRKYVKKYARVIIAVVVAVAIVWFTGGTGGAFVGKLGAFWGNVAAGAAAGAASGLITTGSIKGMLQGAFFGAITAGFAQWAKTAGTALANSVGSAINVSAKTVLNVIKISAHGVIGGLRSVVNGGKFLAGFISGAIGKAITVGSNWLADTSSNVVIKGLVVATAGGLAAELTGGEFAAGFITAGVAFAANHLTQSHNSKFTQKVRNEIKKIGDWLSDGGDAHQNQFGGGSLEHVTNRALYGNIHGSPSMSMDTKISITQGVNTVSSVGTAVCSFFCVPAVPFLAAASTSSAVVTAGLTRSPTPLLGVGVGAGTGVFLKQIAPSARQINIDQIANIASLQTDIITGATFK